MTAYFIVEIAGKQYKVAPGKPFKVDFLGDIKKFDCEKVLYKSKDGKVEIGAPYLTEKLAFEVISDHKVAKIRVAKYHAKANTRKVVGFRKMQSIIQLAA